MSTLRSADPPDALSDTERLTALEATGLLDEAGAERDSLDRLARLAARLTGSETATVTLVDRNRQCFAGATGLEGDAEATREAGLDHSFCPYVVRDGAEVITGDSREHPVLQHSPAATGVVAYAGIPLRTAEGHVLGAFCAMSAEPRVWSDGDLEGLRDLAAVCSREIELVRISRRMSEGALRDELTGLPTRRLATSKLRTFMARARFDSGQATVLYIDLDGFKYVNDDLGHTAGDEVLKMTARRLAAGVRGGDIVARSGGDEFMVVCEDVAGEEVAGAIRARVEEMLAKPLGVPGLERGIPASIGVAMGEPGVDPEELVRQADEAMYATKHGGRSTIAGDIRHHSG